MNHENIDFKLNIICRQRHYQSFNSLTAKSVLVGEKLVLFGRYVLNFYVGIVHYTLRETKTRRAKIYLPTQRTNRQILTSTKKILDPLLTSSMQQAS
jgi:hypothetical protein